MKTAEQDVMTEQKEPEVFRKYEGSLGGVPIESSVPLMDLIVRPKYQRISLLPGESAAEAKARRSKLRSSRGAARIAREAVLWAADNFLLCVERESVIGAGGQKEVRTTVFPERAETLAPSMAAITLMAAWASMSQLKLSEIMSKQLIQLASRATLPAEKTKDSGPIATKATLERVGTVVAGGSRLSREGQRQLDQLMRRIEESKRLDEQENRGREEPAAAEPEPIGAGVW